MSEDAQALPKLSSGWEHRLTIAGEVHLHIHVHLDHVALAAKLREATNELRAAVDKNQPSPPVPLS